MNETNYLDFVTSIGESFAEVLRSFTDVEDITIQDIYSVLTDFFRAPVTAELLASLTQEGRQAIAENFNKYFETSKITAQHIDTAANFALARW